MASRKFEDLLRIGIERARAGDALTEHAIMTIYSAALENSTDAVKTLYAQMDGRATLERARARGRMKASLDAILKEYRGATASVTAETGMALQRNFLDAFHGFTWSTEQAIIAGQSTSPELMTASNPAWGIVSKETVLASVMSENSGLSYVNTLVKNSGVRTWELQAALTRGIASGDSYRGIALSIMGVFNHGYSDAIRVARTEIARSYTEGFQMSFDRGLRAGIRMVKVWDASTDTRTRPTHAQADGQKADANGLFHVGGAEGIGPGMLSSLSENINCRCRVSSELEGFAPLVRRVDGEYGKYVTYEQWARPLGWTPEKGWATVKR